MSQFKQHHLKNKKAVFKDTKITSKKFNTCLENAPGPGMKYRFQI
jgi:hypothetical protein